MEPSEGEVKRLEGAVAAVLEACDVKCSVWAQSEREARDAAATLSRSSADSLDKELTSLRTALELGLTGCASNFEESLLKFEEMASNEHTSRLASEARLAVLKDDLSGSTCCSCICFFAYFTLSVTCLLLPPLIVLSNVRHNTFSGESWESADTGCIRAGFSNVSVLSTN